MNSNAYRLANYVLSNGGWLACAFGAANGMPWLGPVVAAPAIGLHLWLSKARRSEAAFLFVAGIIGTLVDTVKAASGFITYEGGYANLPWLAPLWITALWLIFATQINGALSWLKGRYLLAFTLGAVGGPLAYFAGERLGAISITLAPATSTLVLAIVWGLAVPGLLWVQRLIQPESNG